MTESNTSGSARNVIDAFVTARENQQRVVQGGVVQDAVTQDDTTRNVVPQGDSGQNVVVPNKVDQPVTTEKKPARRRNNVWKILIPVMVVVAVGIVITIVVLNLPQDVEMGEEDEEIVQQLNWSSAISDFVYSVDTRLETDLDYTLEDAERDYEEMIAKSTLEEKYRLVTSYAFFIKEQTGDVDRASDIMKSMEEEVSRDYLARYYVSLSEIYEGVRNEEANRYYKMAVELDNEENGL